ncbi:regulatory protein YcgZ [Pantoea sp.]|uniref:regulatory protein YcgZ n=1 Tax=Pantoea sp. TaxID=69393 RepID=UPI0031D1FF8D
MRQVRNLFTASDALSRYFKQASQPSQQETLGQLVVEILRSGRTLSRKTLCTKLLCRMEQARGTDEEIHYQQLIGLIFSVERES